MSSIAEHKDRQFVNALARGLEILRAFRIGDVALGNQELAERTGLPKPTVSRLTRTLRELDYLSSDPRSGAYALGPGVLSLGYSALANLEPSQRVGAQLASLARETGLVATLVTRDGAEVTTLSVYRGDAPVSVSVSVGDVSAIEDTASGMVMLAACSEARRVEALADIRGGGMSAKAFAAFEKALKRATGQYAKLGFCCGLGMWRSDVNCSAAPIKGAASGRDFAIALSAPAYAAPEEAWLKTYGPKLAEAARALNAEPAR